MLQRPGSSEVFWVSFNVLRAVGVPEVLWFARRRRGEGERRTLSLVHLYSSHRASSLNEATSAKSAILPLTLVFPGNFKITIFVQTSAAFLLESDVH